jgi:hypothetical protein
MFVASVLIGKCEIGRKSDPKIKIPGLIPGTQMTYDSIMGRTKETDVFMVYSNKKAYPSYLITYK